MLDIYKKGTVLKINGKIQKKEWDHWLMEIKEEFQYRVLMLHMTSTWDCDIKDVLSSLLTK